VDVRTTALHPAHRDAELWDVMPGISSCPDARRGGHLRGDDGFALIEVMVSAVLVIVLSLATLSLIDQSGQASSMNRSRGVAAGLAQADQDAMRQSPPAVLANLHTVTTKSVAGVNYTIKSDAEWYRDASGVVTCGSGNTRAEYVQITSRVSWPAMGATKPVVLESYVTPGVASLARGAATVILKRADNSGAAGIPAGIGLSAGGGTVTGLTDSNGCVVLGNLQAGASTASWGATGWVDPDGVNNVQQSVNVATGQTSSVNGLYDLAGSVRVGFTDDSNVTDAATGYQLTWPSVSALQTGMTSGVRVVQKPASTNPVVRSTTPATPTTLDALFPFTTSYTFFAGSCTGADPSTYQSSYKSAAATVLGGQTVDANRRIRLPVRTFAVTVQQNRNVPLYLRIAPDTATGSPMTAACDNIRIAVDPASGDGITAPANNPDGTATSVRTAAVALPYGWWNVCVDDGTNKTQTAAIKNTGSGGTPAPSAQGTVLNMTKRVNGSYVGTGGGQC
jgi:Tfp pilus assembly protein PilV